MHVNPAILNVVLTTMEEFKITSLRIPEDDWDISTSFNKTHYLRKLTHYMIFSQLARNAKYKARLHGIKHTDKVFGLFQTGEMDVLYTEHVLRHLPHSIAEIYYHPDFDSWYDLSSKNNDKQSPSPSVNRELEALLDPKIKDLISQQGIDLITYKDL